MNILLYLIIMLVGVFIGNKKILKNSIMKNLDSIQNFALMLLLFIMGISIGIDKEVVKSFGSIGMKAVVLSIFSVVFSVLGVKMVSAKVLKTEEKRKEYDY